MVGVLDVYQALMTPQASPSQADIYKRNQPYVAEGASNFRTQLTPLQEMQFQDWVTKNKVPFNPADGVSDYDMRGYWSAAMTPGAWRALQAQGKIDPNLAPAGTQVNPNDGKPHYPDYWKTPYHETFSGESQWAAPVAPMWNDKDQLVGPDGRILFDERNKK